jgi:hypothetical protein
LALTLAAVAAAFASPAPAAPVKHVRFEVTLEAKILFSSGRSQSHAEGNCVSTSNSYSMNHLVFASSRPTMLLFDVRKGELRGTLLHLSGRHHSATGSSHYNPCTRMGVVGHGCLSTPQELQGGALDILVRKGRPVSFLADRFPLGSCGAPLDAVGPLGLAPATLTRGHLLGRPITTLTGSHEARSTSSDGTVDSTVINWTLRLVRFAKTRTPPGKVSGSYR